MTVFLLDEHLSPEVVVLCPAGLALALRDWRGGSMLGESDQRLLEAAFKEALVLVTFDLAISPSLLQRMAFAGEDHGGVVFISSRSYAQNEIRGISAALTALHQSSAAIGWTNRAVFLHKIEVNQRS